MSYAKRLEEAENVPAEVVLPKKRQTFHQFVTAKAKTYARDVMGKAWNRMTDGEKNKAINLAMGITERPAAQAVAA